MTTPVHDRALRGASFGAGMGVTYFLFGLVLRSVRGRPISHLSAAFLFETIIAFIAGGAVTGLIVGIAQPLITSIGRSIAVFFIASLPLASGIQWRFYDPAPGHRAIQIAIIAAFLGMLGGTVYWFHDNNQ